MIKLKHDSFNDGVLEYGSIDPVFNVNRKKTGENFILIGKLFYEQMSCRDTDILQAGTMGYRLDLKLKVPLVKDICSKNKVKIDGEIYDIEKFDSDKERIFLYLQKVGV